MINFTKSLFLSLPSRDMWHSHSTAQVSSAISRCSSLAKLGITHLSGPARSHFCPSRPTVPVLLAGTGRTKRNRT
ncbi:hypothetical protein LA080_007840 [Diaporthe eres]|nr:hypothetical protein LA080_007840 [Diaporthe eres]